MSTSLVHTRDHWEDKHSRDWWYSMRNKDPSIQSSNAVVLVSQHRHRWPWFDRVSILGEAKTERMSMRKIYPCRIVVNDRWDREYEEELSFDWPMLVVPRRVFQSNIPNRRWRDVSLDEIVRNRSIDWESSDLFEHRQPRDQFDSIDDIQIGRSIPNHNQNHSTCR